MDELARVCEEIASNASRLKKVALLAGYLRGLNDDDLGLAVQFLSAGPSADGTVNHSLFDLEEKAKLSIGYSILRSALQTATGWDSETLGICHAEVGDIGETTGLLLRGGSGDKAMSLQQANALYQQLFRTRLTARKVEILASVYREFIPLTVKYFIKVVTRGLRIGLMSRQVDGSSRRGLWGYSGSSSRRQ